MPFTQTPPQLGNQYDEDAALRSLLARLLPADVLAEVEPSLREMGRISAELYPAHLADRKSEPRTDWSSSTMATLMRAGPGCSDEHPGPASKDQGIIFGRTFAEPGGLAMLALHA